MARFDWKYSIRKNLVGFKIIGLWPGDDGQEYKWNLYTLYAAVMIISSSVHVFCLSVFVVTMQEGASSLTQILYQWIEETQILIKMLIFIRKRGQVLKLLSALDDNVFRPKSTKQIELITPSLKNYEIFFKAFVGMTVGSIVLYFGLTFFDGSVNEKVLPFKVWYPFDTRTSPIYELTYLHQAISFCFIAAVTMCIDPFMAALMMFIGAQCDLLCDTLRGLGYEDGNVTYEKDLVEVVKHHKKILSFSAEYTDFSNFIIFIQFFTSIISVASTLFSVSLSGISDIERYTNILITMAVLQQIFIFCWFGNEVVVKSNFLFGI